MSVGASVVANADAIVLYKNIAFAGEPLDDCHALIDIDHIGAVATGWDRGNRPPHSNLFSGGLGATPLADAK